MTCHACVCLAEAVCFLPVAMVQPCFGAVLVAAIGAAPLLESGLAAASGAAIALAAITVPANPEHHVASAAAADPLMENRLGNGHARLQAGLDNGRESWQVRTSSNAVTCCRLPSGAPPLTTAEPPSHLR